MIERDKLEAAIKWIGACPAKSVSPEVKVLFEAGKELLFFLPKPGSKGMSDDRKAVEWSIHWARTRANEAKTRENTSRNTYLDVLADAAEKWLATLPEPRWKVRVWRDKTDVHEVLEWMTEEDALVSASASLRCGHRKVEIEKP